MGVAVMQEATAKIDEYARGMISGSGSTLFEELGLYYIGPIDGHNLDDLIAVLQGDITHGCAGASLLLVHACASSPNLTCMYVCCTLTDFMLDTPGCDEPLI